MYSNFAKVIRFSKYIIVVKEEHTNEEIMAIINSDIHVWQVADACFCFDSLHAKSANACTAKDMA